MAEGYGDVFDEIVQTQQSSSRAFTKLRKRLNGDGTIKYRTDEQCISIRKPMFDKLKEMMREAAEDNLERPFFVIFDDHNTEALDIVVGEPGNEGYCAHTAEHLQKAQSRLLELQEAYNYTLKLSRGHSHPVFDNLEPGYGKKTTVVTYGALPSNIFGCLQEWNSRIGAEDWEPRKEAIRNIIATKQYKFYCEDYIESFHSSFTAGFNGPLDSPGSRFHWIVTPRIQQIGVFEVVEKEFGVVVYHPWEIED